MSRLPPTFELGDIRLRALQTEDAGAWYSMLADPLVVEHTSFDIYGLADVVALVSTLRSQYQSCASSRWAIARSQNDQLIGTIGLHDPQQGTMEVGYDLTREEWGQGIATRALRAVTSWGFDELGLQRIQATVMEGHGASVRVLEKCGFRKEGVLRDYRLCRGELKDFGMFALLRRENSHDR